MHRVKDEKYEFNNETKTTSQLLHSMTVTKVPSYLSHHIESRHEEKQGLDCKHCWSPVESKRPDIRFAKVSIDRVWKFG